MAEPAGEEEAVARVQAILAEYDARMQQLQTEVGPPACVRGSPLAVASKRPRLCVTRHGPPRRKTSLRPGRPCLWVRPAPPLQRLGSAPNKCCLLTLN